MRAVWLSVLSVQTEESQSQYTGIRMEAGPRKFNVRECFRMTSVGCTSEPQVRIPDVPQHCVPQVHALVSLQQDDLTAFTDILNTADVEMLAGQTKHWVNAPTSETGAGLLELAISEGKVDFVEVLIKAGAR